MTTFSRLTLLPVLAALSGCGGMFEETTAEVRLTTDPPGASCVLEGADGFVRELKTPVRLQMPVAASPVAVTCSRPGFRPAHGSMEIAHQGWVMRNGSALVGLGADGLALVGLHLGDDSAAASGAAPDNSYAVPMTPVTPRSILIRQRGGPEERVGVGGQ